MAGMMAHKTTTRKKITWSSRRIGTFPTLCFVGIFSFGVQRCICDADQCFPKKRLSCI
jgi:hypothetical protein